MGSNTISCLDFSLPRQCIISTGPTNVSRDPAISGFFFLNGATKTRGFEASLAGYITDAWQVTGGYAYTDARIENNISPTIVAGNRVGLVPYNTFSVWNKYQFNPMWAGGLGVIHYSNFYASSDNTVRIPEFTRVDAAVILTLNPTWRAQLNIENLFDQKDTIRLQMVTTTSLQDHRVCSGCRPQRDSDRLKQA